MVRPHRNATSTTRICRLQTANGLYSLALALLLSATPAEEAGALEVYRIGGADLSLPNQPGVNYHTLPWSDNTEQQGIDPEALDAGVMHPFFFNPGTNIAQGSEKRGGGPFRKDRITAATRFMTDVDPTTFYEWESFQGPNEFLNMDLGALFYVNRVRLISAQGNHGPDALFVSANPEVPVGRRNRRFNDRYYVAGVPENVEDIIDVSFPTLLARNVNLMMTRTVPRTVKVAEVEVYGGGHAARASYVSQLINLGEPAVWGALRWQGRQDPEAGVIISSRSGKDFDANVYWRFTGRGDETSPKDEDGNLLDAMDYVQLQSAAQDAGITYDVENWSFWSAPYDFADSSGTPVLSPVNSILQLRVDFLSTFRDGGQLDFIEFSATQPPLAEEVKGEIHPTEVDLGETVQFTYAIEPTIRAQHSGFDRIEIASQFGLVAVDTVKIGRVPVEFRVQIERPDSTLFSIELPRHLRPGDSGELIEVVFRAPVLHYSTTFDGWVRDGERPLELAQRITAGDADLQIPSEVLVVHTPFTRRLLADLEVHPRILTPNGDHLNEEINFSVKLLQLTGEVPLKLEIYDLSGRMVRRVHEGDQQTGRLRFSWDGRDRHRDLVAPGLYVFRLSVKTDSSEDQQSGTVAVVY